MPQNPRVLKSTIPEREVRVFVSSTFVDMHDERDILARRVFPRLKAECATAGIGFTGVDLRWGVSKARVENGEVVKTCLRAVEDCRPFFIALLGQRYGWVPPGHGVSLTQMEIERGILANRENIGRSFVYTRRASYLETLDAKDKRSFRDGCFRRRRIKRLRRTLSEAGVPSRSYGHPADLEEIVYQDLWESMASLLEATDVRTDTGSRHRAFQARMSRLHVIDEDVFGAMDDHAQGTAGPLVLCGEPGSGKSSLAAAWSLDYSLRAPTTPVFCFFAEALGVGPDPETLVTDVSRALETHFGLTAPVDSGTTSAFDRFFGALDAAAAKGPFVLVLDGLDHLRTDRYSHPLSWLPKRLPSHARLILTCSPDLRAAMTTQGWPPVEIPPLDPPRLEVLVGEHLAAIGKDAEPGLATAISELEGATSPRFVVGLLDELSIVARHDSLMDELDRLGSAQRDVDLYHLIIERLVRDYGDRRDVVYDILGLLAATESGLTEDELLSILELPVIDWLPIYSALGGAWHRDVGRLSILSAALKDSVRDLLVRRDGNGPTGIEDYRDRIVAHFLGRQRDPRRLEEVPLLLRRQGRWEDLAGILEDPKDAAALMQADEVTLRSLWGDLQRHTTHRLVDAYDGVRQDPRSVPGRIVLQLLMLLREHPRAAMPLARHLLDDSELIETEAPDAKRELELLCAGVFHGAGELEDAMALLTGPGFQATRTSPGIAASAAERRGMILMTAGDFQNAQDELRRSEDLWQKAGSSVGFLSSQGNRIAAMISMNRLDEAEALLDRRDGSHGFAGDAMFRAQVLAHRGMIARRRGDPSTALEHYRNACDLFQDISPENHRRGLQSMGLAHIDLRQFDKAEQLLKESLALARTVQDREGEARCVGDLGQLLARQSRWEEAEALLKEQLGLAEDIGARDLMGRAYGNLARVYRITRRDDEADAAHARAEQCFGRADSSSDQGPQSSVVNPQKEATMTAGDMDRFQEALALQNAGQLDEAIPLYEALIARCRRVENKEVLKISLGNLADLRLGRGEHATAEPLYRELINVSVELGDGNMARNAWLNLVVMPFREGKLQDAAHRLMQMLSWGTSQKDPQAVAMAKERLDALGINVTTVSDD